MEPAMAGLVAEMRGARPRSADHHRGRLLALSRFDDLQRLVGNRDARRAYAARTSGTGIGFRQRRGLEPRFDDFESRVRRQREAIGGTSIGGRTGRASLEWTLIRARSGRSNVRTRRPTGRDDLRLDECGGLAWALDIGELRASRRSRSRASPCDGNVERRRAASARAWGSCWLRRTPIRIGRQRASDARGSWRARASRSVRSPAIAATMPVTTPATSLRALRPASVGARLAGQSGLGCFDRRQRRIAGGTCGRGSLGCAARGLARRLPFPRFAGRTRFTRGTRLAG
jgi:hypothetical protein